MSLDLYLGLTKGSPYSKEALEFLGEEPDEALESGSVPDRPVDSEPEKPAWVRPEKTDGPSGEFHLIGPPGCGKTYALTRRWIPKAIDRFGPESVAVCSLTRTASLEIASRQVVPLPRERVATLHSLCRAALTDTLGVPELAQIPKNLKRWNEAVGNVPGLKITGGKAGAEDDDEGDAGTIPSSARRRMAAQGSGSSLTGDELLGEVEILRHRLLPEAQWPQRAREFNARWTSWKQAEQLFDFTDLISVALDQDAAPPLFNGRPVEALFVDEAQDLSALEMALVRRWGQQVTIFALAGDPNQSIYGFRGADSSAFHTAEFDEKRTEVLGQSYRIPPAVQEKAEAFLQRSSSRVPVSYLPREDAASSSGVFYSQLSLSKWHLEQLVGLIEQELRETAGAEGDEHQRVCVLASAAYMLNPLLARLRQKGILYHNPFQRQRGDWNPIQRSQRHVLGLFWGSRPDLRGEDDPRPGSDDDAPDVRIWTWRELADWVECIRTQGFLQRGAKANLIATAAKTRPRGLVDPSDLDRIFVDAIWVRNELLPMIADPDREAEALAWLWKQTNAAPQRRLGFLYTIAQKGLARLVDPPRLVIGTLHSIKGATAGSVILAPDLSRKHAREYSGEGSGTAGRDQVINLFYVGMTRSSGRLHLLAPQTQRNVRLPSVSW